MRGTSRRWVVPLIAVGLALPVATAQAHPADYMYTPGGEYVREIGNPDDGVGTFLQREPATPGLVHAGRARAAARPRDERRDRRPQALRVRRQPHRRQEQQRQPRRRDDRRRAGPGAPVHHQGDGPAVRGAAGRVLARAAGVALAERPDRPAHQLRRQRRAPVLDRQPQQHALLRHLGRQGRQPGAAVPEHARHARVLHLGGPEEPQARADVRRQRRQRVPDL